MTFRFLTVLAVAITNCHFMTVNSSTSMKIGGLNGAHLKIAAAHYPPFHIITLMPNGNYSNIGPGVEYFIWLEKKLNFTFSYVYIPNEVTKAKYGIKSNLAIMTNLFTDNEIDGASTVTTLTLENKTKMDLAYFVWSEPYKMVVPRPGEKSRLLAFVYPFDPLVWGLIYITLHAMVASITFFASIYSKFSINGREDSAIYGGRTVYDRVSYYMLYVFNILTLQGNTIHVSRLSFRILVGVWLLVATVLVYSYSSTVVSHLTVVVTKPHINSLEDLAASMDVELLLLADFFPEEILTPKLIQETRMMSLFVIMVIWLMATNSSRMTVESSSIYGDKNVGQLNRAHLKFAVSHLPPFDILTLKPDGNYTNSGISPILFNWLTEKLNFTISFYYIPDEMTKAKYGTKSDLAIVLDLFTDHVVDGSTMGVIRTPERKKVADFAYFMWTEPFTMVVPVPGEEPRLFAFIKPFQNSVWLLILIAMIVLVVLLSLFSGAYLKYFANNDDLASADEVTMLGRVSSYSIYVVNILTNQGNMVPGGRFSFRILVGVWLLIATVLVNSYSGTVISYLTVPKMKPPINTFEDLAISEDVELILLADSVITMQIMDSHSGTLKILADKMRRNPDNILRNIQKISESLTTSRYAFPFLKTFCNSFVASVYIKEKKCLFKATEPLPFLAGFWSLPFPKNSKYTPFFHSALMELWETGLPPFWVKNGMPRAPKCFAKRKSGENSARQGAIRLDDLSGAFLILGIGFGLATLAFLLEKIVGFNYRRLTSTTVVYVYRNATL